MSCSRSRHVAWYCLAAGGVALGVMRVEVAQLLTSALGCLVDLLSLVVCASAFVRMLQFNRLQLVGWSVGRLLAWFVSGTRYTHTTTSLRSQWRRWTLALRQAGATDSSQGNLSCHLDGAHATRATLCRAALCRAVRCTCLIFSF